MISDYFPLRHCDPRDHPRHLNKGISDIVFGIDTRRVVVVWGTTNDMPSSPCKRCRDFWDTLKINSFPPRRTSVSWTFRRILSFRCWRTSGSVRIFFSTSSSTTSASAISSNSDGRPLKACAFARQDLESLYRVETGMLYRWLSSEAVALRSLIWSPATAFPMQLTPSTQDFYSEGGRIARDRYHDDLWSSLLLSEVFSLTISVCPEVKSFFGF